MKTVLIIDDDEAILSIFSMVLQHHGYRVIVATSGEAGLVLGRQDRPDLILTDISLPGISGRTLPAQLRQIPELAATPIVLMTGDAEAVISSEDTKSGVIDILIKPVGMDELLRCVNTKLKPAGELEQTGSR